MRHLFYAVFFILMITTVFNVAIVKGADLVIEQGREVAFDYTLTVDGEVLDTSDGKTPLTYTHGDNKIISGLSRQLEGMRVGEEKAVIVTPEEGYGPVDPTALQEIPRKTLPENIEPKVGQLLQMKNPDGNVFFCKVIELKKDTIVMDFNHPLAGKILNFQVKIVSIK